MAARAECAAMSAPLLIVIGYVWPEPNSSAAGSRMLELIELFRTHSWRIIFASAAALSEHRFPLADIAVEEKSIALNDASFDQWIAAEKPQAVLFDRFFSEEQFGWRVEKSCPNALRLLDTEDLHCLRAARQKLFKLAQKQQPNEPARQSLPPVLADFAELYAQMAGDDMTQRELAAIYRCDLTLMISAVEIAFLQQYFGIPSPLLCYAPFLSDHRLPREAMEELPSFASRQHFISIGNFRHEPNWDAVLYLKHAIWPLIRAQLPQAELHVYGAYPPPKATQLHQPREGFHVKGWAADAHRVMRHARVCLAPLRFGAGIKGKLMDAMRNGTPSVTTAIGAEAMQGDLLWGGAVENSAEAFAQAAIALYQHADSWNRAQQQGFHILRDHFGRQDFAAALYQRIAALQLNLAPARQQNFTGAMLRHHTLKSTQYMSQWIAAKNRP